MFANALRGMFGGAGGGAFGGAMGLPGQGNRQGVQGPMGPSDVLRMKLQQPAPAPWDMSGQARNPGMSFPNPGAPMIGNPGQGPGNWMLPDWVGHGGQNPFEQLFGGQQGGQDRMLQVLMQMFGRR